MSETPMTPKAARVRLAQYGERTKTWSTATYADGTARALYEIALTLNAEAQTLRARVDALEAQAAALRAPHVRFADSDHCQHDGERWPCPTVAVLGEEERPVDEDPIRYALTEQADAAGCGCGPQMRCPYGHCSRHYMCQDCGNCCSCRCSGEDVTPQVTKLRAVLAEDPARCVETHRFSPRDGWRIICANCDHPRNEPCHTGGDVR
ncbi:hypothetical protein [Streptomyces sp. MMS20-AI2-20]|uniref:hypothetical protein n=1 Tax=Streptomyces sp. MMS20-AI2-20 TaxID=2925835 RepID=UPI001F612271|nr:hypothetical protein [Streptomyces sp. MMS20-AI2-20]MCI4143017.1 hypothetical protein [Streptomyces sp. MMS20-AI2-20]